MSRNIYKCPVSEQFLDPLSVRRVLLVRSKHEINTWLKAHRSDDETVALAADELILPVARVALGLPAINTKSGQGFTDDLVFSALNAFLEYLQGKGLRGQNSQTPSPCAGCPQT